MSNVFYVEHLHNFWSWQQFFILPFKNSFSFLRLITLPRLDLTQKNRINKNTSSKKGNEMRELNWENISEFVRNLTISTM